MLKLVTNGAHLPLYQSSAGLLGFDTLLGQTTAVNLKGDNINHNYDHNYDHKLESPHHRK